jgi:hypothetical protein
VSEQQYQKIHLYSSDKKLSGKGVKYVELSLTQLDQLEIDLLRAEPDINRLALNKKLADAVIEVSVKFVTTKSVPMLDVVVTPATPKTATAPATKAVIKQEPDWSKAEWQPIAIQDLAVSPEKFFTTRDRLALRAIFSDEYNVSQADLDAILSGKATELAE